MKNFIEDIAFSDVEVTDEYCVNAFEKEKDYLLSFDTDKLLAGFRENAGLDKKGAERYGGWESTNIAGHSVGHYLTAVSQAYLHPELTEEERGKFYGIMKTMTDGLRECQLNSKAGKGFIWAAAYPEGESPEVQFDNIEKGKTKIFEEAWVPWYTMHKLIAGITDVYKASGYPAAKELASDLGGWVYERCSRCSEETRRTVLSVEYGGMNDCMYELYLITGKDKYAEAAHFFDEEELFEKVLAGGKNILDGKHANTTIPKFIGALKRYTSLCGKEDVSRYLKYAEAFWENVAENHTYITGGNSEWEHFGKDKILDAERSNSNCETCNSYNMLKLSRELFKVTGEKKYMDYYEQTYYNSILSSQDPETGMTTYFQPMATGFFKVYSSRYDHFWCCTGSGMENFTKLGDTIYMKSGNSVYVNLYQSSVLDIGGAKLIQKSSIPDGEKVMFAFEGNAEIELKLRLPEWLSGNAVIKLSGKNFEYETSGGYALIGGGFKTGDIIEMTLPEKVTAHGLPDNKKVFGFKYGPAVLSAELGNEEMETSTTGVWVSVPKKKISPDENIAVSVKSETAEGFAENIEKHLLREPDHMRFVLKGTDAKLIFSPHYRQHKQRYGIYWSFMTEDEKAALLKEESAAVIDTVQPGYGQYENDIIHDMKEKNSVGVTNDSTYRYAESGGYFSYRMKISESAQRNILVLKFRKTDNGKTIRVCAGDKVIFSGALSYGGDESVYEVKLDIPADVTERCKEHIYCDGREDAVINISFSSDDENESAKVCDFIRMTAE